MISRFKNVLHLTLVKGFVTCEQNIYKQQRLGQGTEGEGGEWATTIRYLWFANRTGSSQTASERNERCDSATVPSSKAYLQQ